MGSADMICGQMIVAVCGVKNSGKTTLLIRLVEKLTDQGIKTAVIKHDGHDFTCDVEGTDSYRLHQAGAYGTAVYSACRSFVHKEGTGESVEELIGQFPEAEIILLEGMKDSTYPKIEVVRRGISDEPVSNPMGRFLIATDLEPEKFQEPAAGLDDIELILEKILARYQERKVEDDMEENKGKIVAICISEKKGTQKKEISEAVLVEDWGIEGDAHAGKWHRQVSMLSFEKIEDFRAKGAEVDFGAFGENLVVEGFDLRQIPVGTRFAVGDAVLELTQIGKECHSHCEIYKVMGDCIMPREGVFTKVLKGGAIKPGDEIVRLPLEKNRPFTAAAITLSDKGAAGEREDKSGPLIKEMLEEKGYEVVETLLLADKRLPLEHQLMRLADQRQVSVIFTTGGTGFSERDVTPEATIAVCDRMAMGIAEAIRAHSLTITDRAMLSRAVSGIRKKTLIVNLPGSPKAVRESLEYILPVLEHGLGILRGTDGECGNV